MSTVLRFIAAVTLLSGIIQAVAPGWILSLVDGNAGAAYAFAIVGFFMALFGGLLWQSVGAGMRIGILWTGLQKVGASAAVFIGIHRGVFGGPMAFTVASFDALSAILIFVYYARPRPA